jgi:predicted ATP-grasp superfamily ATP-dependent carboligase
LRNCSEKEIEELEESLFESYRTPQLQNSFVIVTWQTRDIGRIGTRIADFLKEKLEAKEIGEIKPLGFFSLEGTAFKGDLIQVPESKFWACEKNNLLIFKSREPKYEWYRFLDAVLNFAEYQCRTKELYTVSGIVASSAHTNPRRILTVYNQSEFQKELESYGLEDLTWEGPPAISSYLLWQAQRRGTPGVSLWPEVPFYLAPKEDPTAIKASLSFLDRRFNLGLDLTEFDLEIKKQNEKLAQLRGKNSAVNKWIGMLESGLSLGEDEQMKLVEEVSKLLEEDGS